GAAVVFNDNDCRPVIIAAGLQVIIGVCPSETKARRLYRGSLPSASQTNLRISLARVGEGVLLRAAGAYPSWVSIGITSTATCTVCLPPPKMAPLTGLTSP